MRRIGFMLFLTISLGLHAFDARAQQKTKTPRIGVLSFGHPPTGTKRFDPNDGFRDGMRSLGYVEGRNVLIDWRYAQGQTDRLTQLAAEFVRLRVDVIFAGGPVVLQATMKATRDIPIVVVCCSDPVREGWAQSLPRPGGNVTGLTATYPEISGKRLELLKEAVPGLSRVGLLVEPAEIPNWADVWPVLESTARTIGIQLRILRVSGPDDFGRAFIEARQWHAQAIETFDTAKLLFNESRLSELAVRNLLPSIGEFKPFADAGLLMTYGADLNDLTRRAAVYVDKILKGARAGELPIERPIKFELVVNLKTAKALGLKIPQTLLLQADQVIE